VTFEVKPGDGTKISILYNSLAMKDASDIAREVADITLLHNASTILISAAGKRQVK
jgi:hypothetical protein